MPKADTVEINYEGLRLVAALVQDCIRAAQAAQGQQQAPQFGLLAADDQDALVTLVRLSIDDASWTPRKQHEAWCEVMRKKGWKRGKVYDPVAKTDPALLPYLQTSKTVRLREYLAVAVTHAYLHWMADDVSSMSTDAEREQYDLEEFTGRILPDGFRVLKGEKA